MDYTKLATAETIAKVFEGLRARNIEPIVAADRAEALKIIQSLIPAGASVMNGASVTLEEIGYMKHLAAGAHGWNNLQDGIAHESDAAARALLRRQAAVCDYYLGSVHAVTEDGELLIASGTGSQLPAVVFSAQNVIFVVGSQKIVPTLADAMLRLKEHVFPLEDAKMRAKYGKGTMIGKIVLFDKEYELNGRAVRLILVNEALGY